MSYALDHGSRYDNTLGNEADDEEFMGGAEYKVDLRWDDGGQNRLTDQTKTPEAEVALAAYRALLRREDLVGQSVAARFVVAGRSLYFSNFSKPIGMGRIHPDAPLIADVGREEAEELAKWRPAVGGTGGAAGNFCSSRDALLIAKLYEALSYSQGQLDGMDAPGLASTKARNRAALAAAEEAGVLDLLRSLAPAR